MESIILMMYMVFAGNGLTGEMYMEIRGFETLAQCEATLEAYRENMSGEVVGFQGVCATEAGA